MMVEVFAWALVTFALVMATVTVIISVVVSEEK